MDKNITSSMNSFEFALKTKPSAALNLLFEILTPHSTPFLLPAGDIYHFNMDDHLGIVLLKEGIASLCHSENGMHISTYFSPSVLGLVDSYRAFYEISVLPQHYMLAEIDCECYFVPINIFLELSDKHCLWHDVARILAHRLMIMSFREQELVGVDSYLKVKSLLIELWEYPENYRCKINVMHFILKRTGLSRSRVLAILSDLRKGGYINIKSGKLINIIKLPRAY